MLKQLPSTVTHPWKIIHINLILPHIGVDLVQEYGLGQGKQDNESAVEQAKDEQISDYIRNQYKSTTGSDIPIKDKKTALG